MIENVKPGDMVHIYSNSGHARYLLTTGIYVGDNDQKGVPLHVVMENGTCRMCYVQTDWSDYKIEVVE